MKDKFIVYACPTGELNAQLDTFFQRSYLTCGQNTAHAYMPHCTLTGFFDDDPDSIPHYLQALDLDYREAKLDLSLKIEIIQLVFNSDWHGLELQAEGIKQLTARFARLETSPTRQENIRLKDWLHLSLAYGFEPASQEKLATLARETIDLSADVGWELRFYQKLDTSWKCLQAWTLK